jgi:hypothetical protein
VDSVGTYAAEKFWWQRTPRAHFTPESWLGINDTLTSAGRNANNFNSIDIWGRFRNRAFVGDSLRHSVTGSDTSLAAMLYASYVRCDSIFPGKVDRVGMAPAFDWSPKNLSAGGGGGLDSLWYALSIANVMALVSETQNNLAAPSQTPNPLGFMPQQTRIGSRFGGEPVTILATPQSPDSGSALVEGGMSTDSFVNSPQNSWCKNTESFWDGMMGVRMIRQQGVSTHLQDSGPGAAPDFLGVISTANNFSTCSVLTIHAGDLGSGTRADAAARPTHPGWWAIKSVVNQARIANLCANRQVVIIKYTQDLEP